MGRLIISPSTYRWTCICTALLYKSRGEHAHSFKEGPSSKHRSWSNPSCCHQDWVILSLSFIIITSSQLNHSIVILIFPTSSQHTRKGLTSLHKPLQVPLYLSTSFHRKTASNFFYTQPVLFLTFHSLFSPLQSGFPSWPFQLKLFRSIAIILSPVKFR